MPDEKNNGQDAEVKMVREAIIRKGGSVELTTNPGQQNPFVPAKLQTQKPAANAPANQSSQTGTSAGNVAEKK